MRITIGGYYGYGSLGDDAVLSCLIKELYSFYDNCSITVLSAKPAEMTKKYGVRCINRYDPVSIIYELSHSDLYISGGGTLFQDITSKRSLLYYTRLINLAEKLGTPVFAYANGIGPLKNTDIAAKALKKCARVTLRDSVSIQIAADTLDYTFATLSPDPFFLTIPASKTKTFEYLSKFGIGTDSYFTVNVRKCRHKEQIDLDALRRAIDPYISEGFYPVFVSMQESYDMGLCKKLAAATGGSAISAPNGEILAGVQKYAHFALGMRLHFLLAALISNTPTIALSYDPKVENILLSTASLGSFNAFEFSAKALNYAIAYSLRYPPKVNVQSLRKSCLNDVSLMGEIAKHKENSRFGSKVKT